MSKGTSRRRVRLAYPMAIGQAVPSLHWTTQASRTASRGAARRVRGSVEITTFGPPSLPRFVQYGLLDGRTPLALNLLGRPIAIIPRPAKWTPDATSRRCRSGRLRAIDCSAARVGIDSWRPRARAERVSPWVGCWRWKPCRIISQYRKSRNRSRRRNRKDDRDARNYRKREGLYGYYSGLHTQFVCWELLRLSADPTDLREMAQAWQSVLPLR
jgi:hypothetical protein